MNSDVRRWSLGDGVRFVVLWAACSAFASGAARAGDATLEIGTAVVVKREVVATLGVEKRDLQEGGRVHRNELLETGNESQAELRLDDQTKLALGPNAGLKLDEFVIGKSDGVTTIGVNFLKGTFRFITGSEKKEAYRIETPSATIGVRGTVFDVYVDGSGDTLVLLHEGEVNVCNRKNTCRRHNSVGRVIHTTIAGVISAPIRFTSGLIPGVAGVGAAFPFIGRTLHIDPLKRTIVRPVTKAGRAVTKGARRVGKSIRKVLPF